MAFLASFLTSPWALAVLGVVALGVYWYFGRVLQRCPHCRRLVRRAVRGWFRCTYCGRQYHRSVPRQR
jgi:tRNA(Ile2) C34 agmatinyltransferase TiaS